MCPDRRIDEHDYLAFVVELVHGATEPLDFYRSHAEFTRTDEPRDYVAQANDNVGFEFGYGRPDLGEYEFVDEETRAEIEEFLNWAWPEVLRVRDYESEGEGEGEGGDNEDRNEDESGSNEDEQQVGGDVDGGRVRTNTGSTTTTAGGGGEQDLNTNSESHTNPDNNASAAPAPSNTSTQQATRLAANNDASAGEAQARND